EPTAGGRAPNLGGDREHYRLWPPGPVSQPFGGKEPEARCRFRRARGRAGGPLGPGRLLWPRREAARPAGPAQAAQHATRRRQPQTALGTPCRGGERGLRECQRLAHQRGLVTGDFEAQPAAVEVLDALAMSDADEGRLRQTLLQQAIEMRLHLRIESRGRLVE